MLVEDKVRMTSIAQLALPTLEFPTRTHALLAAEVSVTPGKHGRNLPVMGPLGN